MYDIDDPTTPAPPPAFTAADCGIFADADYGREHVRDMLAGLLESLDPRGEDGPHGDLITRLSDDTCDDPEDELKALARLNAACARDVTFTMLDADLVLLPYGGDA